MKSKLTKALVLLLTVAMLATQIMVPAFAVSTICYCDVKTRTGTLIGSELPTCTGYGYEEYECDSCHGLYAVQNALPLGHAYGTATEQNRVEASCSAAGSYDMVSVCANCGDEKTEHFEIAQLSHTWKNVPAVFATCLVDGIASHRKCDVCGVEDGNKATDEIEPVRALAAKGHVWDAGTVTPPTCTDKGYTTYKCTFGNCDVAGGAEEIKDYVDASGHSPKAPVKENEVPVTCTTDGSYDEVVYCATCGIELSRTPITVASEGHKYEVSAEIPGTKCTDPGTRVWTCSVCSDSYNEVIPEGIHDYDKEVTTEASCTSAEITTYTCKKCGYSLDDETAPALPHTPGAVVVENNVAPTCTTDGSYDNVTYCTATACGIETSRDTVTVPKLGHKEKAAVIENNVAPTCTTDGSYDEVVYCDVCGDELSRDTITVPKLGHSPVTDAAVDETCESTGLTEGSHCDVCGEVLVAQTIIPALGHDITTTVYNPTCSKTGYTEDTCSRCDYSKVYDELPVDLLKHTAVISKLPVEATCSSTGLTLEMSCSECGITLKSQEVTPINPANHNYVGVVTAPTCTEEGYTTYTCSYGCGMSYKDDIVAVIDHDYVGVVTAPTCLDEGYTTYTCSYDCGNSYKDDYVSALGHDYQAVVTEPTCTEDGYTTYTCSACSDTYTDDVVAALGHDYIDHDAKAPTCTEIGWDAYQTCSRCDYTTYVEKSELGHTSTETIGKVDPTCDEKGYTIEKCLVCGEKIFTDYVDATGHTLVKVDAQAATCLDFGWDAYEYCTNTGCELTQAAELEKVKIDALGHDYVAVVTEPTCTEDGYTTHTCSRCSDTYTDTIVAALGHDYVDHDAKAPTCTEIGWDAFQTCTRCDYTTYVEKSALGHTADTAVEENRVEPKCEEKGSYDSVVYCSVCKVELSRTKMEIAELGHDLEVVPNKAATCTEPGNFKGERCKRCDYENVPVRVPLKHVMIHVDAQAPTCLDIGWEAYDYCSRCDLTSYVELPALGHDVVVDPRVEPTYDETGLTEGSHCGRCNVILVAQDVIPVLNESITFTYEALGINGVDKAVNSGYITLNVYMNVNTDIARLYGIDTGIAFNDKLELIGVDGCIFEAGDYTALDKANTDNLVQLSQDMASKADKTFDKGTYLYATLTFKVADDYYYQETTFDVVPAECKFARGMKATYANVLDVDFGTGTSIIIAMLGDADADGVHTVVDTMSLSQWYDSTDEYNTIYDMDKDGYITDADLMLLRAAVVGNNTYLTVG